jgi:hypothetical protein
MGDMANEKSAVPPIPVGRRRRELREIMAFEVPARGFFLNRTLVQGRS